MTEVVFTEEDVKEAEVGKEIQVLGTPRLYLVKNDEGIVRYFYRYPRPGPQPINPKTGRPKSRTTETSVGKPGISLNKAREIAAKYAELLRDGIDPQEAKKWKPREEMTFGQLADRWIDDNRHRWGEKRIREANHLLHTYGKKLTHLRMVQVQPEVVRDALKPFLKTAPFQAHRAREMWKHIIDYATVLRMYAGSNPADWKKLRHLLPGYKSPPRGHFKEMPVELVPEFFRALGQHDGMGAIALKFLLLTLLRTNETLGTEWREINWDDKVLTVPAERMKTGKEFQVPLSNQVIALLHRLKERATTEFVFTGYKRYQPLADKSMLLLMRGMGIPKEISTVHGLRSSYRIWAARKPFDQIAAEICLSHTFANPDMQKWLPFNPAVVEAYQRDGLLDKRREIMDAWASYIG